MKLIIGGFEQTTYYIEKQFIIILNTISKYIYQQIYFAFIIGLPLYSSFIVCRKDLRIDTEYLLKKRREWLLYWVLLFIIDILIYPYIDDGLKYIGENLPMKIYFWFWIHFENFVLFSKLAFLVLLSIPNSGLLDKICISLIGINKELLDTHHITFEDRIKNRQVSRYLSLENIRAQLMIALHLIYDINSILGGAFSYKKDIVAWVKENANEEAMDQRYEIGEGYHEVKARMKEKIGDAKKDIKHKFKKTVTDTFKKIKGNQNSGDDSKDESESSSSSSSSKSSGPRCRDLVKTRVKNLKNKAKKHVTEEYEELKEKIEHIEEKVDGYQHENL